MNKNKTDKLFNFIIDQQPIKKLSQLNQYIGHHLEYAIVDKQVMSNLEITGFDMKYLKNDNLGYSFSVENIYVFPVDYFDDKNYKSIFKVEIYDIFCNEKELITHLTESAIKIN
jgi:hypothetical protein